MAISKKTRNTIGSFLVWGGIAVVSYVAYTMYLENSLYSQSVFPLQIGSIVALLIGGLWGMKK